MGGDWAAVLLFCVFAAVIAGSLLAASVFLSARADSASGVRSRCRSSRALRARAYDPGRFSISYYLTAMMFIVFDIEMVFLAPLAVLMNDLGAFGFVELFVFVALLGGRLRLHLAQGSPRMEVVRPGARTTALRATDIERVVLTTTLDKAQRVGRAPTRSGRSASASPAARWR